MKFAGKWKELENIILSEVTETQKDKHGIVMLMNKRDSVHKGTLREDVSIASDIQSTTMKQGTTLCTLLPMPKLYPPSVKYANPGLASGADIFCNLECSSDMLFPLILVYSSIFTSS
ncbi:hypothetical protein STEG23_008164, partial [Scotinomys teguina]